MKVILASTRSTRALRIRASRSSTKLWTDRAPLQGCGGCAARDYGVTLAQMKSREFLVEWVWRFFPLRAVFYRGAKRESKRWAAKYLPTFGKFYVTNRK